VDPTLTLTQEVVLSESVSNFGIAAAVDGDTAVVGASAPGQVFIFSRNLGGADAWGLSATLNDPYGPTYDSFGSSVAVNGDTVVVAGYLENEQGNFPSFYIYERNVVGTGNWGLAYSNVNYAAYTASIDAESHYQLAVYGNTVVAGVYNGVTIFDRNENGSQGWGATTSFSDPQANAQDCYGCTVLVESGQLI
jgi:hypothetical protein